MLNQRLLNVDINVEINSHFQLYFNLISTLMFNVYSTLNKRWCDCRDSFWVSCSKSLIMSPLKKKGILFCRCLSVSISVGFQMKTRKFMGLGSWNLMLGLVITIKWLWFRSQRSRSLTQNSTTVCRR